MTAKSSTSSNREVPITTLLTPAVAKALRKKAEQDGRTVSTYVERLVRKDLRM